MGKGARQQRRRQQRKDSRVADRLAGHATKLAMLLMTAVGAWYEEHPIAETDPSIIPPWVQEARATLSIYLQEAMSREEAQASDPEHLGAETSPIVTYPAAGSPARV